MDMRARNEPPLSRCGSPWPAVCVFPLSGANLSSASSLISPFGSVCRGMRGRYGGLAVLFFRLAEKPRRGSYSVAGASLCTASLGMVEHAVLTGANLAIIGKMASWSCYLEIGGFSKWCLLACLSVTIFVQPLLFWRCLLSEECSALPVHAIVW